MAYVGVLFLDINYLLFPDDTHGLSEFHSVECHMHSEEHYSCCYWNESVCLLV